jgi:hypothetical protein
MRNDPLMGTARTRMRSGWLRGNSDRPQPDGELLEPLNLPVLPSRRDASRSAPRALRKTKCWRSRRALESHEIGSGLPFRNVPEITWIAALVAGLALASTPSVPPPSGPGAWRQVGAAVTSRPGKALHFYRASQNPHALSFVVTSRAPRPIRVFWWSYCEFLSDDNIFEEHEARVSGVGTVTVYPPVLDRATLCYVSVNATPPAGARVSAAIFDSSS